MANFSNVKFLYGTNVQSAITLSSQDGNKGHFYIVAGDDASSNGVIALNGHAWYEAAGGITSVSAGTKDNVPGLYVTETDGSTETTNFIGFKGNEGSGVTVSAELVSGNVVYKADVQLADASSITDGIQTLGVDDNKKLDGSIKLSYTENTGVLAITNKAGQTTSVNLPLESFLEDAVFKASKADAQAWVSASSYSATTGVTSAIESMTDEPSLILIMHTSTRNGLTVHTEDKAIIVPIGSIVATTKVQSSGKTAVVSESSQGDAKTYDVEVNNDAVTIKQYVNAENNGFSKTGVDANELYVSDAIIEQGFKVLGGNVGQLANNTTIDAGTTVIELLKKILVKEADCAAVKPTCTLNVTTTGTVEVGTVVSQTLTSTYTDGKFTGSTADYGTAYSVNAGCTQGTVTYKRGTTTVTSPDNVTMAEGTTKWSCTSTYEASTVTPKKNNGDDSSKTIAAGTTASSEKSVTAQYKYYYGSTTAETVDAVTTDGLTTGWTTIDGITTIKDENPYTMPTGYFVVMCASKYKLNTIVDSDFGVDMIPNFTVKGTKTVTVGGGNTETYNVFIWKKSPATTPVVKNITLAKV